MNIYKHLEVYKGLPRSVYVLFISTVINKIGGFITPLMTLILSVKIGLIDSQVGLVSTIAMLSQAPFIMLGGTLVDKFGAKKVLVSLHSIGAVVYLTCAMVEPGIGLAVMIIIASNLYAMASSAPNAIIPKVTPKEKTKNAYSLLYLGLNVGLAIGPLIGGFLFNDYLSLLFIIDAVTTVISAALVLFLLSEIEEANVHLESIEDNNKDEFDGSIVRYLLSKPVIIIFSTILLVYNFGYIQWNFLLPLQFVEAFSNTGARYFSILLSVNAVTVVALSPILTSLTHDVTSLKSMFFGGIFYFVSFILFGIGGFFGISIISIVIMTVGEILIAINANNYIASSFPKKLLGRANSLIFIVSGIGYAIGPGIMGYVISYMSFLNAWLLVALLTLFATILMLLLSRFDRKEDMPDSTEECFEE